MNTQKLFNWSDVSSCHLSLEAKSFYGVLSVRYEEGKIVLLRLEQTLKPE